MRRDILYGQIKIDEKYKSILNLKDIQRLKDISLSAVPSVYLPIKKMSDRFEHSLGVAHLAKISCENEKLKDYADAMIVASIFHDVGSSPFSHLSEIFQKEIFGKNHEEYAHFILKECDDELKKLGLDYREIGDLIEGKGIGVILNGGDSMDLDNLDNSLRYGRYAGVIRELPYSPEYLAKHLSLILNNLENSPETIKQIEKYNYARKKVYVESVYSDANWSKAGMLIRAINFAYLNGELSENYFRFTDTEAINFLSTKCNNTTKELMKKLNNDEGYKKVAEISTKDPSEKLRKLCDDWKQRIKSADEIGEKFKIPRQEVCIVAARSQAVKNEKQPYYLARVFVNPNLKINEKEIISDIF
ncbi:MAG: HD domain-containing protein [Candidatus Aenigmarchaeota archaeon]|nr:HD domain-containing protein [Candidatus Aenigmarchaeota archaeon]